MERNPVLRLGLHVSGNTGPQSSWPCGEWLDLALWPRRLKHRSVPIQLPCGDILLCAGRGSSGIHQRSRQTDCRHDRGAAFNQSISQSIKFYKVAKVVKTTARSSSERLVNVQETVRKWLCEETQFESPANCKQRLSRCHILRQVVQICAPTTGKARLHRRHYH